MSVMSSLLLFLLCLTVYACNARRLGIMDKESSRQVHLPGQVGAEWVKLNKSEEVQAGVQGFDGAKTQKLKDTKALSKGAEESRGTISELGRAGTQNIMLSSDVGLRPATEIEGSERQVRSLVGFAVHVRKEIVDYKENDIKEDVIYMDYAQPGRKPPIHNSSP